MLSSEQMTLVTTQLVLGQSADDSLRESMSVLFGGEVVGSVLAPYTAEAQVAYDCEQKQIDVGLVNDYDSIGHRTPCVVLNPPTTEEAAVEIFLVQERGAPPDRHISWFEAAMTAALMSVEYAWPLIETRSQKLKNVAFTDRQARLICMDYMAALNSLVPNGAQIYDDAYTLHSGVLDQVLSRHIDYAKWEGADDRLLLRVVRDSFYTFAHCPVAERDRLGNCNGRVICLHLPHVTPDLRSLSQADLDVLRGNLPRDDKELLSDCLQRITKPTEDELEQWTERIDSGKRDELFAKLSGCFQYHDRSLNVDYNERMQSHLTPRSGQEISGIWTAPARAVRDSIATDIINGKITPDGDLNTGHVLTQKVSSKPHLYSHLLQTCYIN